MRAGRWVAVDAVVEGRDGFRGRLRAGRGAATRVIAGVDERGAFTIDTAAGLAYRAHALRSDDPRDALTAQWQAVRDHMTTGAGAVTAKEALAALDVADAVRVALQQLHVDAHVVDGVWHGPVDRGLGRAMDGRTPLGG